MQRVAVKEHGVPGPQARRLAGLWTLPSGATLVVEPRKGSGADLFAWICAIDPRLIGHFRGLASAGTSAGDVGQVAVRTFCALLLGLVQRTGARRQYRERREERATLRGRVEWAAYARQSVSLRIPCVHWERDLDTPLNRLLSLVLHRIAASEVLRKAGGGDLAFLLDVFGHVPQTPPASVRDLGLPLSRLDAEFEPARRLAVVLLDELGLALGGSHAGLSFQVNLARLFEQTVERAVCTVAWSEPPAFQFRPAYEGDRDGEWSAIDTLVRTADGPLVVDAKYASSFSKSHLYQVLAYMKMVGARCGALVYPTGAELGSRRFRALGTTRWDVHVLDLDIVRVSEETGSTALRDLGAVLSAIAVQP